MALNATATCDIEDSPEGAVAYTAPDFGVEVGPEVSVSLVAYRSQPRKLRVHVMLELEGNKPRLIGDPPQGIFPTASVVTGTIRMMEHEPSFDFLGRAFAQGMGWLRSHISAAKPDGEHAMLVSEEAFLKLGQSNPDASAFQH